MGRFNKNKQDDSASEFDRANPAGFFEKLSDNPDAMTVLKWAVPVAVCAVIMIGASFVFNAVGAPNMQTVAEQQKQITDLKNTIDKKTNSLKTLESKVEYDDSISVYKGSMDEAKQAHDEAAKQFFAKYCTWSDGITYENLRSQLADYGYVDGYSFIDCFLPKQAMHMDAAGNFTYEVDEKQRNLKFEDLTSYRLKTDGDSTYYAGIVQVSTTDLSGGSLGSNVYRTSAYVTYTMTGSSIGDVTAYALME